MLYFRGHEITKINRYTNTKRRNLHRRWTNNKNIDAKLSLLLRLSQQAQYLSINFTIFSHQLLPQLYTTTSFIENDVFNTTKQQCKLLINENKEIAYVSFCKFSYLFQYSSGCCRLFSLFWATKLYILFFVFFVTNFTGVVIVRESPHVSLDDFTLTLTYFRISFHCVTMPQSVFTKYQNKYKSEHFFFLLFSKWAAVHTQSRKREKKLQLIGSSVRLKLLSNCVRSCARVTYIQQNDPVFIQQLALTKRRHITACVLLLNTYGNGTVTNLLVRRLWEIIMPDLF